MSRCFVCMFSAVLLFGCAVGNVKETTNTSTDVVGLVSTNEKGKYVALSYSKAAGKLYLGRSYSSYDDALNNAVASCSYSDCRTNYVGNVDGCVAFAFSGVKCWGRASGKGADEASGKALKLCNAYTTDDNCKLAAVLCPEY